MNKGKVEHVNEVCSTDDEYDNDVSLFNEYKPMKALNSLLMMILMKCRLYELNKLGSKASSSNKVIGSLENEENERESDTVPKRRTHWKQPQPETCLLYTSRCV